MLGLHKESSSVTSFLVASIGGLVLFVLAAMFAGSATQQYFVSLQANKHQQEVKDRFWTIGRNQPDLMRFAEAEVLESMGKGLQPINIQDRPAYLRTHLGEGRRAWLAKAHIQARGRVDGIVTLTPPTNVLVTLRCQPANIYVDCLMHQEHVSFKPGETITVRGKARQWDEKGLELLGVRVLR